VRADPAVTFAVSTLTGMKCSGLAGKGGDAGRLSVGRVLAWARAYRARWGRWPTTASGVVAESPDTTWMAVNAALRQGSRGLPGVSSLARLLRGYSQARRGRIG
jgi:hypothetical protein